MRSMAMQAMTAWMTCLNPLICRNRFMNKSDMSTNTYRRKLLLVKLSGSETSAVL